VYYVFGMVTGCL